MLKQTGFFLLLVGLGSVVSAEPKPLKGGEALSAVVTDCESANVDGQRLKDIGWELVSSSHDKTGDDQVFAKNGRLLTIGSVIPESNVTKTQFFCMIEFSSKDAISQDMVAETMTSRFGSYQDSWVENGERSFSWFSSNHAYTLGPAPVGDGHALIIIRDTE
ncbi:hypothetical protein [Parasphingorhabdus sp.]|uniref:hypothetical protein n=1 Tax=Parasphingorhabdus sp. TaxID=2709688 RepID=UPI003BB098A5